MTSRKSSYMARLKTQDPEKYAQLMEKSRLRCRAYRQALAKKWEEEPHTQAQIEARQQKQQMKREREAQRYRQKKAQQSQQARTILIQAATIQAATCLQTPAGFKRRKDMTEDERRAHDSAMRKRQRHLKSKSLKKNSIGSIKPDDSSPPDTSTDQAPGASSSISSCPSFPDHSYHSSKSLPTSQRLDEHQTPNKSFLPVVPPSISPCVDPRNDNEALTATQPLDTQQTHTTKSSRSKASGVCSSSPHKRKMACSTPSTSTTQDPSCDLPFTLSRMIDHIIETGWKAVDMFHIRRRQFQNDPPAKGETDYAKYLEIWNTLVPPSAYHNMPSHKTTTKKARTTSKIQAPSHASPGTLNASHTQWAEKEATKNKALRDNKKESAARRKEQKDAERKTKVKEQGEAEKRSKQRIIGTESTDESRTTETKETDNRDENRTTERSRDESKRTEQIETGTGDESRTTERNRDENRMTEKKETDNRDESRTTEKKETDSGDESRTTERSRDESRTTEQKETDNREEKRTTERSRDESRTTEQKETDNGEESRTTELKERDGSRDKNRTSHKRERKNPMKLDL